MTRDEIFTALLDYARAAAVPTLSIGELVELTGNLADRIAADRIAADRLTVESGCGAS